MIYCDKGFEEWMKQCVSSTRGQFLGQDGVSSMNFPTTGLVAAIKRWSVRGRCIGSEVK